jgi:UDP-N-acetylmuramoyl-tripeptide--D-alanyl-D-alanine ligase
MIPTIKELTSILEGELVLGSPKQNAISACVDSRLIQPGQLYFALKGQRVDGHEFVLTAAKKGASGVVVNHLNWLRNDFPPQTSVIRVADSMESLRKLGRYLRLQFQGSVIGITGSNGKTTVKQMTAKILGTKGPGLFTQGNFNSQIGLPLVLSNLEAQHQWMVLEMGASSSGDIASLCEMAKPSTGVITSIGPAHLATFGSLKLIAQAKWELIESLPHDGCAILPWAEPSLESLVRNFNKRIVFFGEDPSCPIRASSIETKQKIRFLLNVGSQNSYVELPVSGRYNVSNALAAAAVGWVHGYSIAEIVQGLESFEPAPMRSEMIEHKSGALILNDAYNANPASMSQSLQSLNETYPKQLKVLILGSMLELGPDSDKLHFHIGTQLGRIPFEKSFLVGPETKNIFEGAVSVGANKEKLVWVNSVAELDDQLFSYLKPNHVLFFKASRGVQLEKGVSALFEDRLLQKGKK